MKKTPIKTICPCGNELKATIAKPTRITPTTATLMCWDCGSSFVVKCRRWPENKFSTEVIPIEITSRAKHIVGVDLGIMQPE